MSKPDGGMRSPESLSAPYAPDSWRHCSPASLRGHIRNIHLRPDILWLSLPRHDAEVAQYRGIGLGWVAKGALETAALPDDQLKAIVRGVGLAGPYDHVAHRERLLEAVHLFDELGLVQVPWPSVEAMMPGASVPRSTLGRINDESFYTKLVRSSSILTPPDPELAAQSLRKAGGADRLVDVSSLVIMQALGSTYVQRDA